MKGSRRQSRYDMRGIRRVESKLYDYPAGKLLWTRIASGAPHIPVASPRAKISTNSGFGELTRRLSGFGDPRYRLCLPGAVSATPPDKKPRDNPETECAKN